ncbi:hypothetical protein ACA910_001643 [Epithemia clementina (nom. ined.)]
MDCHVLAHEISTWTDFEVECHWRVVSIGKKGCLEKDKRVQAIHVIVDDRIHDQAEDTLRDLYSSTATQFPLGTTMCLVPKIVNFTDPKTAGKCRELWAWQRAFQANMKMGA